MRKIIFFNHVSLDGFVAGPKGEMKWIRLPEALFDFVGTLTERADSALYGRITYEMMRNYWPTAGQKPNATKHEKVHSAWYNRAEKIVLSRTLDAAGLAKTRIISKDVPAAITELKQQPGKNIQIFGSPSVVQLLLNHDLIDEFYLSVNPIILGNGKPQFDGPTARKTFKLSDSKTFPEGLVVLHYMV